MVSSDEEGEVFPDSLTEYEFYNQKNDHVSFAFLPLLWHKDEPVESVNLRMFLSGFSVDGLRKIYTQVFAWRFELSYVQPEISVLCKDNHWVKLLKPKKVFEGAIRSILITIQCLHFVKHNPEANKSSIWCHLSRVFSTCKVAPSEVDYMNHISLIRNAAERDKTFMNSEYMLGIILEKPATSPGKVLQMEGTPLKRDDFIADEDVDDLCDFDDSEEDLFDTMCSLCDNGGDILCCEGRCMRSFHATEAAGEGLCESLGLSAAQVNAMPNFICKNCQYEQHQCFICGKLGSSDISSNPKVFPCIAASCGRFYHPTCVSKKLHEQSNTQVEDLEERIAAGEAFACPAHKCSVCKLVENRDVGDLQFAVCRRCPKSYHRKCLPRKITFEDDYKKGIFQRAWDGLLIKRILIYCLDHEIDPELGTPQRDHIVFPGISKVREPILEQRSTLVNSLPKKRKLIPSHAVTESVERKNDKQAAEGDYGYKWSDLTRPDGKGSNQPSSDAQKKLRLSNLTSTSRDHVKFVPKSNAVSTISSSRTVPEKSRLNSEKILKPNVVQPGTAESSWKRVSANHSAKPVIKKQSFSSPTTDINVEERINALIERVNSSFDVDKFMKQQIVPSNYKTNQSTVDKNLTKVKVEVTVKAVRAALQKLNSGGTVDDAKSLCSAEMLRQIPLWKKKLDVYLAPFLHGMTYSSYGRHFTKLDKLEEIVERLHCYVQDGDTIVDFCCGANDFSWLMKKKLDSVGKKCNFKNYDLFPSKNDFNFEQRDWFSVQPKELPEGSRLIMGLNPPFGYKATLANQFINKALKFQPKLLILVVPPETQRLDSRTYRKRYDLIWEDPYLLAGESFYLPGSCNADAKQLSQWNKITPPLYLWSRPDWTLKHREIAHRSSQFQLSGQQPPPQPPAWNYLAEEQQNCIGYDLSNLLNEYDNFPAILDDVPEPSADVYFPPDDNLMDMDISPTNCFH